MIGQNKRTRRGFIAAATVTAVGSLAFARSRIVSGDADAGAGMITILPTRRTAMTLDKTTTDAWNAAVGSLVYISGEHGMATARILSVVPAMMGGERPKSVRAQALAVAFETDPTCAPDGDRTYTVQMSVPGVRELFLTRGEDVLDKAVLLAILN